MFTEEMKQCMERAVLCWLATSSKDNIPNVSPKELFTTSGDDKLIIANIASPQSVRNIVQNENVCVSLIDVFAQKGFQFKGKAVNIPRSNPEFLTKGVVLLKMAGERFPIVSLIEVTVTSVKPIVAPSYSLYPDTREEDQIASAMKSYGVHPL